MNSVVDVANVGFAYDDRPVLEDISLSVEEGEFIGLIGPNGSGKTTLVKIMLGLMRPDSGSVSLFGQPAASFSDGTRLGYVSQKSTESDQVMPITVREVVRMGRYPHAGLRRLTSEDARIVDEALARVGITDLADKRIGRLSGGQKQRAYIARALACEADLLALDEPTVGVDADSRDAFYDLLEELNGQGITILLIEHDIGVVTEHVDTVVCINRTLYHHGSTESFLEGDALTRAYGGGSRPLARGLSS